MAAFFDARVGGYEAHMMQSVTGSERFYPETVKALPLKRACGCSIWAAAPGWNWTGCSNLPGRAGDRHRPVRGLLDALQKKHAGRALTLIQAITFTRPSRPLRRGGIGGGHAPL
jgi:hypothetical protein